MSAENEIALMDFDMRVCCLLMEHSGISYADAEALAREEVREERSELLEEAG